MRLMALNGMHHGLRALFAEVGGGQVVSNYGDTPAEYTALHDAVALLDLGFRSRLCLLGADRKKFLHGQVTNQVNELQVGQGCYAALVTAKGKIQSDLFIYCLDDELLLDFEPGLAAAVLTRLDKYIIADDVQGVDVSEPFGHLSVQGPRAAEAVAVLLPGGGAVLPAAPGNFVRRVDESLGDLYIMNRPRTGSAGFDIFAPTASLEAVFGVLLESCRRAGGRPAGWDAMELARIEAAIPRYGADMDEANLPPEAGLDAVAVHYGKGCYIGQEVIARIRTYGQVAKALRGLRLESGDVVPSRGDKILWGEKEIGQVTSACVSPGLKAVIALGYLRREHNKVGDEVLVRTASGDLPARVVTVPFQPFAA